MAFKQATLIVRPVRPEDGAVIVELFARRYGGHFTSTEEDWLPETKRQRLLLAAERAGTVIGAATLERQPGWPDGYRANILTEDQSAWTLLHEHVLTAARGQGAAELFMVTQDFDPTCGLAEQSGYEAAWQSFGAHLDLAEGATVPAEPVDALPDGLVARELEPGDETSGFELYTIYFADAPKTPSTMPQEFTAVEFAEFLTGARGFGVFAGDRCVAMTVLTMNGDEADTEMTVTAPDFRQRGVAGWIKRLAIRTLAEEGVTEFSTGGAFVNTQILHLNERLGYQIEPLWLTYRLALR